jgi:hypothetical protein
MAMRDLQFDPFGETLQSVSVNDIGQGWASKVALRLGVGLFWSLVGVIVAARVVFFDSDVAKSFGVAAANLFHNLIDYV